MWCPGAELAPRVYVSAVDGRSSAPDPGRELSDPRAQSYGPDQDDPEVAPAAEAAGPGPPASAIESRLRSLWRRGTSTRLRRVAVAAGGLVGAGAIVATVVLVFGPRPDATLHRTTAEVDARVVRLATDETPWLEIDGSTLRSYGSYLGLELWSAQNAFGSTCLLAVQPSINVLSEVDCAPPPADVFIDVSSSGDSFDRFPGEGIIRFWLRGDTVDAYLYYLPQAE